MTSATHRQRVPSSTIFDPKIVWPAVDQAFAKLDPWAMMTNPVMFVVETVALLTTVLFVRDLFTNAGQLGFTFQIILWLWITVLFANFAEAVAEGRGKAQAAALRDTREKLFAKLIIDEANNVYIPINTLELSPGHLVLVEAGDLVPSDGDVVEGRGLGQRSSNHG